MPFPRTAPELWGGVECTCNRVRNRYIDQSDASGHRQRLSDFDRFAALGIGTLRFGLLWERYEREGSWRSFDEQLGCLREVGIRPIAGLLHHGSGPPHTDLTDPEFPEKLAAYAAAVVERYPWIDAYTPVNEPHTTARFSGMYGIWYPHAMSRRTYLQCLLHQVKGTVLSMQEIRRVRPEAVLIQTEDLGVITGTRPLQQVWQMLDLRRWLGFDLLCGRVDLDHPMFWYMRREGIAEQEILWFREHPCPPNVIGLNYYLTSDRFLDHRLKLYPERRRSAEGPFVDVELVRVAPSGIAGFESLLMEAWERYEIPVAITEVHLGGPVDEQIRWVAAAWNGAMRARRRGAECCALTIWALLGSYYWNELVRTENGHYEPGVFDVRDGAVRPTQLAGIVQQLAEGRQPMHPALAEPGWWESESRICFPLAPEQAATAA